VENEGMAVYSLGTLVEDGFAVDFGHGQETLPVVAVPVQLVIIAVGELCKRGHVLPGGNRRSRPSLLVRGDNLFLLLGGRVLIRR
jgi:hypothetical protein